MTPAEFHILLVAASFLSLRAAKRHVVNDLPVDLFLYRVSLNQSLDGHAEDDDVLFPEDDGRAVDGIGEQQVVELLCRDGRVPQWVDLYPEAIGDGVTVFRLDCCGRYTDDPPKMYYARRGLGPFGIKSPVLPPAFRDGDRLSLPTV